MPEASKQPKKPAPSTKRMIDIAEIRDGVVVMRDGSMRAVFLVSSVNFYLKNEDEQQAIVQAYVALLNSLDFPLQIVAQSRILDITPYMARLDEAERTQTNELLKFHIVEYRSFVKELVELGDIMTKRFFVVVPFSPLTSKRKGFFGRFKEVLSPNAAVKLKEEKFLERKRELDLRVHRVLTGLQSMSLAAAELDTQSLIELYYSIYNPDLAQVAKLAPVGELQVEV